MIYSLFSKGISDNILMFQAVSFAFYREVKMPQRASSLGRRKCLLLSVFVHDWLKCRRKNTGMNDNG